jgi:hypothetical protein
MDKSADKLDIISLASSNHSGSRRRLGNSSNLLSLDISSAAQDLFALLGLFTPIGRGAPYHYQ